LTTYGPRLGIWSIGISSYTENQYNPRSGSRSKETKPTPWVSIISRSSSRASSGSIASGPRRPTTPWSCATGPAHSTVVDAARNGGRRPSALLCTIYSLRGINTHSHTIPAEENTCAILSKPAAQGHDASSSSSRCAHGPHAHRCMHGSTRRSLDLLQPQV
jgi:hypothetical protein